MSYCLNPQCPNPSDPEAKPNDRLCQHCGSELVLKNKYRVTQPMGSGGFGKTFEVLTADNKRFVLKVLYRNHPKAVSLFQQEAKVLGRLNHPGIPAVPPDGYFVYWPHESDEPLHCLIMEKIEGLNLKEWLTRRNNEPITQEEAIEWLEQLSDILEGVHQLHYFHRDIKPHNIMRRVEGQLALIDFGTAREVTGTYLNKVGGGQNVTEIISAGYTPPEQINGKAVPQSDFYALGRTFVYLLTGKRPTEFPENPRTGKLLWRDSAPHASRELGDIIDYLMAPFPGNRPQSAKVILQMLAEIKGETPEGDTGLWPFKNKKNDDREDSKLGKIPLPERSSDSSLPTKGTTQSRSGRRSRHTNLPTTVWPWVAVGVGSLLALTQIYGSLRYGLFPVNPIAVITNFPNGPLLLRTIDDDVGFANTVALTPDGSILASGSYGTIKLWNRRTGEYLRTIAAHNDWVRALSIGPEGNILASGSDDGTVRLFNFETGARRLTLGAGGPVNATIVTPGGTTLIAASEDPTIRLWDFPSGQLQSLFSGHTAAVKSLALSPDGRILASGGGNGDPTVRLWSIEQEVRLRTLSGHRSAVLSLAISPDGNILASGSEDNTIILWDLNTGERLQVLEGMDSWVRDLTFSQDGKYLIAAGDALQVWAMPEGKLVRTLAKGESYITAVETTLDGDTLVTASHDRTLKVWRLP